LPIDQGQQLFVLPADAALAEIHQHCFIQHRVLQPQSDETPPTQTVADQLFPLRIGQVIAMHQQAHLDDQNGAHGGRPVVAGSVSATSA